MPALHFGVDRKHFAIGTFRKEWRHDDRMILLKHESKMTGDSCVFKFSPRSVD